MSSTKTIGQLAAIAPAVGVGSGERGSGHLRGEANGLHRPGLSRNHPGDGRKADAVGFLNNIYTGKQPGGMEYVYYKDDSGDDDQGTVRWIAGTGSFDGYSLTATREGIRHTFIT